MKELQENFRALSAIKAFHERMHIALPAGVDTEDYVLRSILSEDVETISNYGRLFGQLAGNHFELARKIVVARRFETEWIPMSRGRSWTLSALDCKPRGPEPPAPPSRFCAKCGNAFKPEAKFCVACGSRR